MCAQFALFSKAKLLKSSANSNISVGHKFTSTQSDAIQECEKSSNHSLA